jgi:hypothetical protein
MALGRRRGERQLEAFVVASDLPKSPGYPFYTALNILLAENGFDPLVENLCASCYAETMGRPSVPPGPARGVVGDEPSAEVGDLDRWGGRGPKPPS